MSSCTIGNALVASTLARWEASPATLPDLGPAYRPSDHERGECALDHDLARIDSALQASAVTGREAEQTLRQIIPVAARLTARTLALDDPLVRSLLSEGLSQISLDLLHRARTLDREVNLADILQAARNAWTACALQLLLGKPMRLTPSIFAYSMLYPYSDNYLDDAAIPGAAKIRFNERFGQRLQGESLPPLSRREETVWELVSLIESEYPRAGFPQVYASLLAIHSAQHQSLEQSQGGMSGLADLLALTVTKGGASVLADAYLAAGDLTAAEARVAFEWGVVLQLGDDLQDFRPDQLRGSRTLFTQSAKSGTLDLATNQTLHFASQAMRELASLESCPRVMQELVTRSSRLLLIRSAAFLPEYYTPSYLRELERHCPFRFDFLRQRERRIAGRRACYGEFLERLLAMPS